MKPMLLRPVLAALGLCLAASAAGAQSGPSGMIHRRWTELGPQGDENTRARFQAYVDSGRGCEAAGPGPRAILTGFGLFSGVAFNISGAVVDNLSSEDFWPTDIAPPELPAAPLPDSWSGRPRGGILNLADGGARFTNRAFRLDGELVNVCLIELDVRWDFAGAVIAREMDRFQPQAVVMTGVGSFSPIIEAGATNSAGALGGFGSNGAPNLGDVPQGGSGGPVLPNLPAGATIPMLWDNRALGARLAPLLEPLLGAHGRIELPPAARPSNDYICNNVSYVALQAAAGRELHLAGGRIVLQPRVDSRPSVGFFHYPAKTRFDLAAARLWARGALALVEGALEQQRERTP